MMDEGKRNVFVSLHKGDQLFDDARNSRVTIVFPEAEGQSTTLRRVGEN